MFFSHTKYIQSISTSFHKYIPKIELHAHLHGSIRPMTMIDLAVKHKDTNLLQDVERALAGSRDLKKCFRIFTILHELVASKPILERIISETLEDMMENNVIYCELRSTPRSLSDGTSMEDYIKTLLQMTSYHNQYFGEQMIVKLLISIDRSKDISVGEEILYTVLKLQKEYPINDIVGLDFSGNPSIGSFDTFKSLFVMARENNLKITVHAGELSPKQVSDSEELTKILKFRPDRLGHALFLEPQHINYLFQEFQLYLVSQSSSSMVRVPAIEICPTSNYFTMDLKSYKEHPIFQTLYDNNYPLSINTDDSGVFGVSLSDEYQHIQDAFGLTNQQMIDLSKSVIDQIFAENMKEELKRRFYHRLQLLVDDVHVMADIHCDQESNICKNVDSVR